LDIAIVKRWSGLDEEELRRRYYERVSDWSEPGAVKINRNGKLLGPPSGPDRVERGSQEVEREES
jgi:hypothetical protein